VATCAYSTEAGVSFSHYFQEVHNLRGAWR
jgi:hypothetical protein